MKDAHARALDLWKDLPEVAQRAIDLNYRSGKRAWMNSVKLMFKEHARDQRHACAERVSHNPWAHAEVMHAPAPGEEP